MSSQILLILKIRLLCFFFLPLSCMNYLYILDINLLSDIWFANIFSHSVGCFLIILMISFAVQKLSVWWNLTCLFVLLLPLLFQNGISLVYLSFCCLCFSSQIKKKKKKSPKPRSSSLSAFSFCHPPTPATTQGVYGLWSYTQVVNPFLVNFTYGVR